MSRTVTRLYRSTLPKINGWYQVTGSAENSAKPGPGWRLASRRERAWHAAICPRFSWVEFLFLVAVITIFDEFVGVIQPGPTSDFWKPITIGIVVIIVAIWLWGLWRSGD